MGVRARVSERDGAIIRVPNKVPLKYRNQSKVKRSSDKIVKLAAK